MSFFSGLGVASTVGYFYVMQEIKDSNTRLEAEIKAAIAK